MVGCSRPPLFSFAVEYTFMIISCRWVRRHMSAHTCSVSSIKYKLASCWAGEKNILLLLKSYGSALLQSAPSTSHMVHDPFLLDELGGQPGQSTLRLGLALEVHLHGHLSRLLDDILLASSVRNLSLRSLGIEELQDELVPMKRQPLILGRFCASATKEAP